MKRKTFPGALLFVPALVLMTFAAAPEKPDRNAAAKLMNDGNFKEAFDGFSSLALDPADDPAAVGNDLTQAIECLRRLNRVAEFDSFIEKVILAHKDNGLLLFAAAGRLPCRGPPGLDRGGQFHPRPASRRHGEVRQRLRARSRPRAAARWSRR